MDQNQLISLVSAIDWIHSKGWAPGTGGNFSVTLSTSPLRLLMSPSGKDKGQLKEENLLVVGDNCEKISGEGKVSAEALLHLTIVKRRNVGSILHTHSVWNTILSKKYSSAGALVISGYEMLKGLSEVSSHEHTEIIPILKNSQDMEQLSRELEITLQNYPDCHGVLLASHGLYTWGDDIECAKRHLEVLEFLFEVLGRVN